MTREEAIKTIENAKHFAYDDVYTKAFDTAIKALEQEPFMNKACVSNKVCEHDKKAILDKISARIELEKLGYPQSVGYYKAIMKCLQIIDKYKKESEET